MREKNPSGRLGVLGRPWPALHSPPALGLRPSTAKTGRTPDVRMRVRTCVHCPRRVKLSQVVRSVSCVLLVAMDISSGSFGTPLEKMFF